MGPAAADELKGLVRSGIRLLKTRRKELSLEIRFGLAYNAAHALALAALRYRGYRSESGYLVFQCLVAALLRVAQEGQHASRVRSQRDGR